MTRMPDGPPRAIRSFAPRSRRRSPQQQQAFETLWARFGRDMPASACDPQAWFDRAAPLTFEIGFGRGEALLQEAADFPQRNVLGIEVHPPSLLQTMREADRLGLHNVRIISGDATELLPQLPAGGCRQIRILFPDPWPKRRHRKRRLIQDGFASACARCTAADGVLHIATDWADYADQIEQVLRHSPDWRLSSDLPARPETHFERRGQQLGHTVREWAARRLAPD